MKPRIDVSAVQTDVLIAGSGAGLNLPAATHVVHFDRWWNPAVENQATDRAFRIGQGRNMLVHKFVCRGTVEDKIDTLIESKQQLSKDLLEGGAEMLHVPYKGSSQVSTVLISGEIAPALVNPVSTLPHVKAGEFRLLAITTVERC